MSTFFPKNQNILLNIVHLLKAVVWELSWRFLSFVFSFCKIETYCYWKCKFTDSASRTRLLDCSKLVKNYKKHNNDIICWHDAVVSFFLTVLFASLVRFSYWSKFHVNIITGSGVMTSFFYNRLTINSKIGNTPVQVFRNIWRLGQVRDIKFDANVFNEMFLNDTKCQGLQLLPFLS